MKNDYSKNLPGFGDPATWPKQDPEYDTEIISEIVSSEELDESIEATELIEDMGVSNYDLIQYFVHGAVTDSMKVYIDTLKDKYKAALNVAVQDYIDDCEKYRNCPCKECVC